jgi:hypothetical protein
MQVRIEIFAKNCSPTAGVGCENVLTLRPIKQIMSAIIPTAHFEESSASNSTSLGTLLSINILLVHTAVR